MIEKDNFQYLQTKTALITKLGGVNKICAIQAPTGILMPYLIIEPAGGTDARIGASKLEENIQVRIAVDCGPTQMLMGREAIELAKGYLENLRGKLGDTQDLIITCGAISGFAGLNGAYRWGFSCQCKYLETFARQRPST